jgi:ADP-heptose:LPS heptosyltransferase
LIFLLGSLGDTLVALPALKLIARRFPSAQRRVLTDRSVHPKAASMATLLDGTGLVHDYFWFPGRSEDTNRLRAIMALARDIRVWKPDVLVYLHEQRGQMIALRDAGIFKLLGIRRLIGIPVTRALQRRVFNPDSGRFEHRAEYLARSLASLGDSSVGDRASWDLVLSSAEHRRAQAELGGLMAGAGVLAMSIGTKVEVNDWGDENWLALLTKLSRRLPGWSLIALGAPSESARSDALLTAWHGNSLNLCGKLSVRESGAVLERMHVFIGHDSGPMHLAAAVGTPCAAIFSARNLPGTWFPYGPAHRVFYKKTECAGCQLSACIEYKKKCIAAVEVDEVCDAVVAMTAQPERLLAKGQ